MKFAELFNPATTAIILIELQNDFCAKGGKLHENLRPDLEGTRMLENISALLARARDAGCLIVHTPYEYNPLYRDASETFGVLSSIGLSK